MKTKFTKGEWMIARNHIDNNNYNYSVLSYGRTLICDVMRHNFIKVGKSKYKSDGTLHQCNESEANAKLIAAAPKLFEMLDKILSIEDHAFTLKGFDVKRLKLEIQTVLDKAIL